MSIRSASRSIALATVVWAALAGSAAAQVAEPTDSSGEPPDTPAAVPAVAIQAVLDTLPGPRPGAHGWEEAWKLELSRGVGTAAVWVDSLLLVASLDRNVHLVAPGRESATIVWDENFRGGFEATPLVTAERIYLPETRRGRRLVALRRGDRSVLWTADAGDLAAAPVARGEVVFTVSSEGEVSAWGPNGTRRWRTELRTRVVAAPILLGDALVIAASRGTLHALDPASGAIRDEHDPDAGMIWGDPVPVPGSTDAALFATVEGQLIAVRADLSISDRRSFPSRFYTAPAVARDRVYLIGHEGTAWAYDWKNSSVVWKEAVKGVFRAAPAAGERFVAFGSLAGNLYLLDAATGALLWHTRLNGAITGAPTTVGDTLYAATERGTLYHFRPTG